VAAADTIREKALAGRERGAIMVPSLTRKWPFRSAGRDGRPNRKPGIIPVTLIIVMTLN
jgi:hypothetical protein